MKDQERSRPCTDIQNPGFTHSFQQPLSDVPKSLGCNIFYLQNEEDVVNIKLSHSLLPSNPGTQNRKEHVQNTDLGPGIYIFFNT